MKTHHNECFAYTRVSTAKQGEGVSLEAQKDAIQAFADQNDLVVSHWFEEKETAAKSGRPVFSNMMKQLHQRKASGVIIHKIDRSARNLSDWAKIGELSDACQRRSKNLPRGRSKTRPLGSNFSALSFAFV